MMIMQHFVSEAAERFKRWGGGGGERGEGGSLYTLTLSQAHPRTQISPKYPLRSSLAQANLFAIVTVSSVAVIDL